MLFVLNPNAGTRKARRALTDILEVFCRAGYTPMVHITSCAGDATRIVEKFAQAVDLVVCCGGDGTFSETVNGIMRSGAPTPVGYIPAGTTNDFATSLDIPADMVEAAVNIVTGEPVSYDIGQFGDRYFTYVASFGAFTRSSYTTPQNVKNVLGHAAYVLEGLKDLSQIRPLHIRMELEQEVIEDDFVFGAITNSFSVGGVLALDPDRVDLSDGKFEILLVRSPEKRGDLTEALQALQTKQYDCHMITFRKSATIRIFTDPEMVWTLDGERAESEGIVDIYNRYRAIRLIQKG